MFQPKANLWNRISLECLFFFPCDGFDSWIFFDFFAKGKSFDMALSRMQTVSHSIAGFCGTSRLRLESLDLGVTEISNLLLWCDG